MTRRLHCEDRRDVRRAVAPRATSARRLWLPRNTVSCESSAAATWRGGPAPAPAGRAPGGLGTPAYGSRPEGLCLPLPCTRQGSSLPRRLTSGMTVPSTPVCTRAASPASGRRTCSSRRSHSSAMRGGAGRPRHWHPGAFRSTGSTCAGPGIAAATGAKEREALPTSRKDEDELLRQEVGEAPPPSRTGLGARAPPRTRRAPARGAQRRVISGGPTVMPLGAINRPQARRLRTGTGQAFR